MPAPVSTPAARRRASSRSGFPGLPPETRGHDEKDRDQLRNPESSWGSNFWIGWHEEQFARPTISNKETRFGLENKRLS